MTAGRLAAGLLGASLMLAPTGAVADAESDRAVVEFLTSAELEGRVVGTPGEPKAAEYLAGQLESLGARPLPGHETMLLPFELSVATEDAGSSVTLRSPEDGAQVKFQGVRTVRAIGASPDGTVRGDLVFAGYGLTVPEGREADVSYDSYAGLNVEGKIVLALAHVPSGLGADERAVLSRYAAPREKARRAFELGAKALLLVTGPRSSDSGSIPPPTREIALDAPGFVAAGVGGKVAERIFSHVAGRALAEVQAELDTGNPHVSGFAVPGLMVEVSVAVDRVAESAHNVVGYLPGAPSDGAAPQAVVLGARFDSAGTSAAGAEVGKRFAGADDASGVAALLAVGRRLADKPSPRPVILALWSAGAAGQAGSAAFLDAGIVAAGRISAYVGFDHVGRMRDDRLLIQGVGSSRAWSRLIEQTGIVVDLDLRTLADPFLPTDSTVFYRAGVPAVSLTTGSREEHGTPRDLAATIDYAGLASVEHFAGVLVGKLRASPEPPEYVEMPAGGVARGDRDGARAFTGTVPDYASGGEGLRLSGVVPGGPAEAAGLREGDVIVEFAGREVANAYDYMHALEATEIDVPVRVVFLRDGERKETIVTPTARK